jgi:hypothetical protein
VTGPVLPRRPRRRQARLPGLAVPEMSPSCPGCVCAACCARVFGSHQPTGGIPELYATLHGRSVPECNEVTAQLLSLREGAT